MGSITREIVYFDREGLSNLDDTLKVVMERWRQQKNLPVLCFTSGGESALRLVEMTDKECRVVAVTYPYGPPFRHSDDHIEHPSIFSGKIERELEEANIAVISGVQAFDEIIIPGASSVRSRSIKETLRIISGGLALCVSAILMACSAGQIEPQEEVIAFSADTAIVGLASLHTHMFHPGEGLEIKEILCKPHTLSQTRPRDVWKKKD